MSAHPKVKGNISEAAILFKFVENEIPVCQPFGEYTKYDLVVEINGELKKVQVKTGRLRDNTVQSHLTATYRKQGRQVNERYSESDVDLFAIYCIEIGRAFLIPYVDISQITIRLDTNSRQKHGIRFADDCDFDTVLDHLKQGEVVSTKSTEYITHRTQLDEDPRISQALKRLPPSGFRGVRVYNGTKQVAKYECYVSYKGRSHYVGRGNDAKALAEAYDAKAVVIAGGDAITNKMLGLL